MAWGEGTSQRRKKKRPTGVVTGGGDTPQKILFGFCSCPLSTLSGGGGGGKKLPQHRTI